MHPGTLPLAAALCVGSYALFQRLGVNGLLVVVPLWTLALPLALWAMRAQLRRHALGVAFLFFTAGYAETLDNVLDVQQRVSFAILLLGAGYLVQQRRRLRALEQHRAIVLLALFFAQACASAALFGSEHTLAIFASRASMGLAVVCATLLAQSRDGRRLFVGAVTWGVLMSLPLMLRELVDPAQMARPWIEVDDVARAGGLWAQPNNAGASFAFVLAFVDAQWLEGALPARVRWGLFAAASAGVLATASRGAFITALAIIVGAWVARVRLSVRGPMRFGGALAVLGLGALLLQPAGELLARAAASGDGLADFSRLQQVILALSGSTDELVDHDSHRLEIADRAIDLIAKSPLIGHGTGEFEVIADSRSHVEFLEILGENGLVGGVIYGLLLWVVFRRVSSLPPRLRYGAYLVGGAWLLTHFDNHNLLEYRYMMLPLGYLCGVSDEESAHVT